MYRPVWTCGRYNTEHQAAIYYNLISGISFYFEDFSAQVIGKVLEAGRNGSFELEDISKELNISMDSLLPFFKQLEQLGLVSSIYPSEDIIADYRKRQSEYNCKQTQEVEKTVQEKLPYATTNAEMMYTDRVGGITSVMFELTYRCSEKCIHCYNEGATRNDDEVSHRGDRIELTLGDYIKLIEELYNQGLVKVCLTGGDPFSKSIAWDIIKYLYNKDIAFDIFTNGQGITKRVKELADYFPRSVDISIYSGVAEDHDYITRISGSWEKSIDVVKQLSALSVPMNLKCCVMRPNVKSYYKVADIARKYGAVPQFEVSITDSVEGDQCASKFLRLTRDQLDVVLRDSYIPLYVGKEAPNYGGQKKQMDSNPCSAGYNSLCITPEGNVIPCCSFHALFGNVKKQSISDILTKSKALNYWRSLSLNDYEECGRHKYCAYCNLCPGINYSSNGTPLKASENNCFLAKERYNLAIRLKNGEDPLEGKTLHEAIDDLPNYEKKRLSKIKGKNYSDKYLTDE